MKAHACILFSLLMIIPSACRELSPEEIDAQARDSASTAIASYQRGIPDPTSQPTSPATAQPTRSVIMDEESVYDLAGDWEGTAIISDGSFQEYVYLHLSPDCTIGEVCGTYDIPDSSCSGDLILEQVEGKTFIFLEAEKSFGEFCVDGGHEHLRLLPDGKLFYQYSGELPSGEEINFEGILTRVWMDTPGESASSEASVPALNLVDASAKINGGTLEVVLQVQDLPQELEFERPGMNPNRLEYEWGVEIDVDNDPSTGNRDGFDYRMSASYFADEPIATFSAPINQIVQVNVWKHKSSGGASSVSDALLIVDLDQDTLILRGYIPGLSSESRLVAFTYDTFGDEETLTIR